MYLTLFQLAGIAMAGWLLLILLPAWRVTRWIAATAIFPIYLSILYAIGIIPIVVEAGPGIMRDFGSAPGVLALMANPDVALIAWIHILAFDQAVALYIYRDNLERRVAPLPLQSVILFLTLMFGPAGLLAYLAIRSARGGARRGEATTPGTDATAPPPSAGLVALRAARASAVGVLRRERAMTAVAAYGIAAAGVCAAAIALRGSAFVAPEGHLQKAMAFDLGVGIYLLTLALYLPHATFRPAAGRLWRTTVVVVFAYSISLETIQILRGVDPRFTAAGGIPDQVLGSVFGLAAILMIVTFLSLAWAVARRRSAATPSSLHLALRYGVAGALAGFASGIWMSVSRGSLAGEASILPLHAAGFHALQAIPAVALLLAWSGRDRDLRGVIHIAGVGWIAATAGIAWHTAQGLPLGHPGAAWTLIASGVAAWTFSLATGLALLARSAAPELTGSRARAAV